MFSKKKNVKDIIFNVCNAVFMIFMVLIMLYPFWYVLMCSFSETSYLIGDKGAMLLPHGFDLSSYRSVFQNPNIISGYKNTLIVVVVGTSLNLLMTSIGAFVLSRKDFAIKKVLMTMIIITMYFSGGMIPTYLMVYKYLHLGDTLWALILPNAIATYNLIIMKTNFESIPASLEESAKIDGAGVLLILFRIVLPLSLPILAVMALFYSVDRWNSWFNALIYLRDSGKYPLQLVLRTILMMNDMQGMANNAGTGDKYTIGEGIKYATIIVATVPILCVYPFIQKYFMKGMMVGAIKE